MMLIFLRLAFFVLWFSGFDVSMVKLRCFITQSLLVISIDGQNVPTGFFFVPQDKLIGTYCVAQQSSNCGKQWTKSVLCSHTATAVTSHSQYQAIT